MNRVRFVFLLLLSSLAMLSAQYFPATGRGALHQSALDTRSRLNVLSIAFQPGQEDVAALAYYRLALGARIVSAFVTNGEAGESDVRGEFPNQLAATRRMEAARVMEFLNGEEYFLNMPDLGAVSDTEVVQSRWSPDTLQMKLAKLIEDLKPDVILLARNWNVGGAGPEDSVVQKILLEVLRREDPEYERKRGIGSGGVLGWTIARVMKETGSAKGVRFPLDEIHPVWKKSYRRLGEEAAALYRSCAVQRKLWYGSVDRRASIAYENIYPKLQRQIRRYDEGFPQTLPPRLRGIDQALGAVTKALEGGAPSKSVREQAIRGVAALIDSVDGYLFQPMLLNPLGRKTCAQWKNALEHLRVTLRNVEVHFSIDPAIVTDRQVIYLKIDSVSGLARGDSVWLYFPATDERWMVDESAQRIFPLRANDPYRLLSPQGLDQHLPAALNGLARMSYGRTYTFFVMCRGKNPAASFLYRCTKRLLYSPRLTTEVLTPIVRAVPNEELLTRITNHSRDGIRDSVHVDDSLAVSEKQQFRINTKDVSELDTLHLQWRRELADGTYLIPVSIAGQPVANFAARSFMASVDTMRAIALITGINDSPTAVALRRLGLKTTVIRESKNLESALDKFGAVILDRRALTLLPGLHSVSAALRRVAERGGHLIVLAQDAEIWNQAPIVEGLSLTQSNRWSEGTELIADRSARAFSQPNIIANMDWDDWLYRRAYNVLSGPALVSATQLLITKEGKQPLVTEWTFGTGSLTYVDLALTPQFLNVHPGVYRLLANLTAY